MDSLQQFGTCSIQGIYVDLPHLPASGERFLRSVQWSGHKLAPLYYGIGGKSALITVGEVAAQTATMHIEASLASLPLSPYPRLYRL